MLIHYSCQILLYQYSLLKFAGLIDQEVRLYDRRHYLERFHPKKISYLVRSHFDVRVWNSLGSETFARCS